MNLVTRSEYAELCKCSKQNIHLRVKWGSLPSVDVVQKGANKAIIVKYIDIDKYPPSRMRYPK